MRARTSPQNRLFHALVRDVFNDLPMAPWRKCVALEAWKRYFIALMVREVRMEAYGRGDPDPFPVRPVPSSGLNSWQMADLIECTYAWGAQHGIEWSEKTQRIEREL